MIRYITLLLILVTTSCGPSYELANVNEGKYRISDTSDIQEDPEINTLIAPYKAGLDGKMNQVINQVDVNMSKGKPESKLGNWMTDLINEYAEENIDQPIAVTVQNYGGIRINSLTKGPLTVGKIYEIMPFDNELGYIKMTGSDLLMLFEKIALSGGWPMSHQANLIIDKDGKLIEATIDGNAIDNNNQYIVVLSDYIAFGGDKMDFLKEIQFQPLNIKVRDAMIEQSRKRGDNHHNESAVLDKRITIQK